MNISKKYNQAEVSGLDQVELESRALIRTASALNQVKEHWEESKEKLPDALDKNRLLWTVLASAMREEDCKQPPEVRKNILNLALFIFQRTISILADPKPESLKILIDINMNIAKGLNENSSLENPKADSPK